MDNLEDVFKRIRNDAHKVGVPLRAYGMTLYLWLDTDLKTCKPIAGIMNISFEVDEKQIFAILRAIDKETPIYSIKIGRVTHHIIKTETYMNRRCEV